MNLKQSMKRRLRGHGEETDVNLTAVMNIFLILIPFLLLTATFMRISVLELTLPSLDRVGEQTATQKRENVVFNKLQIRKDGFALASDNMKFPELTTGNDGYNWQALSEQLGRVKEKHPETEDIIISPENEIRYETIITVMDRCREAGFPNISISG
jgi:biopolymer transport protein ExbD